MNHPTDYSTELLMAGLYRVTCRQTNLVGNVYERIGSTSPNRFGWVFDYHTRGGMRSGYSSEGRAINGLLNFMRGMKK